MFIAFKDNRFKLFKFEDLRGWDDLSVNISNDPKWTLVDGKSRTSIEIYPFEKWLYAMYRIENLDEEYLEMIYNKMKGYEL